MFWQWGFEPYVSNMRFGKCRHCEAIQVQPQTLSPYSRQCYVHIFPAPENIMGN